MDEQINRQVDKIFQDSLQSHRENPVAETWEVIEKQLDKENEKAYAIKKSRNRWITYGLLVILIAGPATIHDHWKKHDIADAIPTSTHSRNLSGDTQIKRTASAINNQAQDKTVKKNYAVQYGRDWVAETKEVGSVIENHELYAKQNLPAKPLLVTSQGIRDLTVIKPEKRPFTNRISVMPYFSKEFAGYTLSDDDATAANGKEIEERERNVFSASLGFYLDYRINKRWVIQSGISYSWSNSVIDSAKSYAVKDDGGGVQFKFNTISGYGYLQPSSTIQPAVGDSVLTAKAYSQLHYLTVPLILSYSLQMNRFSLLVGAGASINFLTSATVETKIYGPGFSQDESAIPIKGLKKINYGVLIKAELEYHMNSTWGISLIPCFKNTLSPINIHSALSAYPYNIGIGIGLHYRL